MLWVWIVCCVVLGYSIPILRSTLNSMGHTLFLCKRNGVLLGKEIHSSTLHIVGTSINTAANITNLAAQNITGCSHRLSSGLTSQSSRQWRFPCNPLCIALFAGLYIRTVFRWRDSGAPETISAGSGVRSSRGGVGAGTWAVVPSGWGMDFSPVSGLWVIVGGWGVLEEL